VENLVLSRNGTDCLHALRSGEVSSFRDERSRLHDIRLGYIHLLCAISKLIKVLFLNYLQSNDVILAKLNAKHVCSDRLQ